jgi:hypothetical protein
MKFLAVVSVVSSLLLAACGSGDSAGPTAEGLWIGSMNNSRSVTGLVFDDGAFYLFYSTAGNPAVIAGVVQGNGNSDNGTFSSTNARDFNVEGSGVLAPTFSASYQARQSLNGTIGYTTGGAVTFTSTFNAKYDNTPSLAALAGTFSGVVFTTHTNENSTIVISSAGAITGTGTSGCTVTGTVTPRARGNAFNTSLTFGGAPCIFPNQTMTGVAYFDAATKRVYVATPTAARTDVVLFLGTKP